MTRSIWLLPLLLFGCGSDASPPSDQLIDAAAGDGDGDGDDAAKESDATITGCADRDRYKNVYFGDLHVHTSFSLDAYAGYNRNDPAAAYQHARGTTIPIAGGAANATIDRPLDFGAVTDHAEFLSLIGTCELGAPGAEGECDDFHDQGSAAQTLLVGTYLARLATQDPPPLPGCAADNAADCLIAEQTAWSATLAAAATANAPCEFTSLVAYEWTATTLADNLHRNVIFASDQVPDEPYDYLQYPTPLALWQALDAGCRAADGCDAITIPHNSNYSGGVMWTNADDDALTREMMARYQTLVEIYQHKSASECMPGSALADPSCHFEHNGDDDTANAPGYVRDALAQGLALRAQHGVNPITLGIVGATDTHNSMMGGVAEQSWVGHMGTQDYTPELRLEDNPTFSPGGITAVWAAENTREEIFAALKRRETYATSGPRMAVRTYALAGVANDAAAQALCDDPAFPAALVEAGAVPMGGELAAGASPYFFVAAMADATPLASFDVVRLRLDATGEPAVSIHDVTLTTSAQRSSFCKFWKDPDFAAGVPAIYYTRVFEQPTPRWSAYDCMAAPEVEGCSDGSIPQVIRERAWTSPIYVTP